MVNRFGGFWTVEKIEIFIKYLYAYLEIMKNFPYFKLIYFDGFAGSGHIDRKDLSSKGERNLLEGITLRVLGINHPKKFHIYYCVDLSKHKISLLEKQVIQQYPNLKNFFAVPDDCNNRIRSMCSFMKEKKNSYYKALVVLDPYGMSISYDALKEFKGVSADVWVLVPTGIVMNRMIRNDGSVNQTSLRKMSDFTGKSIEYLESRFYKKNNILFLFEEFSKKKKKNEDSVNIACDIYSESLKEIWTYVSRPMPMKNSKNVVMYHFIFASNNHTGFKIAEDILMSKMSNA